MRLLQYDSSYRREAIKNIRRHRQLYLIILPPVLLIFIFNYIPMYGVQIAFRDYRIADGIWESPWVGFKYFIIFFKSYYFERLLFNTISLSLYSLAAGILPPVIVAIALNETRNWYFKKSVQMILYAPHFLSTVIITSMINQLLAVNGSVNRYIQMMGYNYIQFLGNPAWFQSIYVLSGIWQGTGYGAIIYLAALAGINQELYESARVDGVSKWQQIRHIDIPGILPTFTILLILSTSRILSVGFEKVLLLQNSMNISRSDVIDTYVYRMGLLQMQFSLTAAVGLAKSVVGLVVLYLVNLLARKVGETSLW